MISENSPQISPTPERYSQKEESTPLRDTPSGFPTASWIILFILAGLKDILEIVLGLIPVIGSFLVIAIGAPLSAIIFLILWAKKLLGARKIMLTVISQIADNLPVVNFLPTTSLIIFLLYIQEKKSKNKNKKQVSKFIAKFIPKIQTKI